MPSRPKWPWITLIILQALQLLSLLPWLMIAGFSVMAFDSPGSEKAWQPWALVLGIWSYPLWLLLAAICSWLLFVFRKYAASVILAGVLTLPVPAFFIFIAVASME